jgi:hypothetical protein
VRERRRQVEEDLPSRPLTARAAFATTGPLARASVVRLRSTLACRRCIRSKNKPREGDLATHIRSVRHGRQPGEAARGLPERGRRSHESHRGRGNPASRPPLTGVHRGRDPLGGRRARHVGPAGTKPATSPRFFWFRDSAPDRHYLTRNNATRACLCPPDDRSISFRNK